MITKNIKKRVSAFMRDLSYGVGQKGFLAHVCEEYQTLMDFQFCHFAHLQSDGQYNFEYKNKLADYDGMIKYQHEDLWRPENSGTALTNVMHLRIDKASHLDLSDQYNLYNWLYNDIRAIDALGTIHPCYTAFTCLKLGKKQLDEEEYKFHLTTANEIINLYYIDRRLNRGKFFEFLYSNQNYGNHDSPTIILDSNFNTFHEENEFKAQTAQLRLKYPELIFKIQNKVLYSNPKINEFDEEYRLKIENGTQKLSVFIRPVYYLDSVFYICHLKISDINSIHFTSREQDILDQVCAGLSNNEIAERLFISKDTVKKHLYNMMQKTSSRNRIELLKFTNKLL